MSGPTDEAVARRIGLVLALGGLLVVLDTTIVIVAVPAVVADLGTTLPTVSWATTGYLLGVVAVIPLAGWAAARVGDRRLFVGGLAAFTLFSVVAGLAATPALLIAARVLQGLGGGLLNPVGQAIGLRAVPRESRGRMMSLLGLPVLVGPVLGPPLAGWLVDVASWRAVFLINLPVGLLAIVLCLRVVPPGRATEPRPLDVPGVLLLPAGAASAVAGATLLGDSGVPTIAAGAALVVGIGLLTVFVRHAARRRDPLLAVRLLRRRTTAAGLGVLAAFGAGYFGAITVLPLVVQGVRGDPAALAGGLGIPAALAVGVTLQIATRLVDRMPARRIVVTGTVVGLVGTLVLAAATATGAGYAVLVLGAVVLGIGSGATLSPTMTTAVRDLEGTDTAAGTTLMALVQQLAGALGIAAVTSALTVSLGAIGQDVGDMTRLPPDVRAGQLDALGAATAVGYLVPAAFLAVAVVVAAVGLRRSGGRRVPGRPGLSAREPRGEPDSGDETVVDAR